MTIPTARAWATWLTRRAYLADAHSTSITPPPTQLHHWMLTLALLVFVGATTARPRHADEVGPSAKKQRRRRGKFYATDVITEAIIEFPDTAAGYNDCRTMVDASRLPGRRVTGTWSTHHTQGPKNGVRLAASLYGYGAAATVNK